MTDKDQILSTLLSGENAFNSLNDVAIQIRAANPAADAATVASLLKGQLGKGRISALSRSLMAAVASSPVQSPVQDAIEIAQALAAAGFSLPDIAAAIVSPDVYPNLTALQLGQVMLAPKVGEGQSREQLGALLIAVNKYSAGDIQAALTTLFPQPSVTLTIAASQQGGTRGVELWALPASGQISTLYQKTAGGAWSNWEGPGFKGQPAAMVNLAAAQQNNGNLMLFTLDKQGSVRAVGQGSPGGDWNVWTGPSLAGQPLPFVEIAASAQGGTRGVECWAVGANGQIWTLYQKTPGGPWSNWEGPGFKGQPVPMRRLAAALQNNGNVMLFTLDDGGFVYSVSQQSPGGDWNPWTASKLGGQPRPFGQIAASEQKGSRGVELWGVGDDGQIWTLYQRTPGGPWSNWEGPGFKGQPKPMRRLAAALQNNGNVMLFTVDDDGRMWSVGQQSPGGDWAAWAILPPL